MEKPVYDDSKDRKRTSIVDQIPSSVYNDDDSLQFIKQRDKDRDAEYVKQFAQDVAHVPIKKRLPRN